MKVDLLDIDPPEHNRQYVRDAATGDRGYFVFRGGRKMVKLDRASQAIERVYNEREWLPDNAPVGLSNTQIAQVAFEADKKLCLHLRMPVKSRREWVNMKDEQRIKWIELGPSHPERKKLYDAIKAALSNG